MANRYSSSYSDFSPNPPHHQPAQVSTQTLLTALHTAYSSSKPYPLDVATSLVVNTWLSAAPADSPDANSNGPTVDVELAQRAFEHATRRTEDACIVLGSLHDSTPSLFAPFVAAMPFALPSSFHAAVTALTPFLNCVTPQNPSTSRAYALSATFTLTNESGRLKEAVLCLSQSGIDVQSGLINIPPERGYRAFDALYYLLSSASTASEREFLGLKAPSAYSLLKRSETYSPPAYVPTADDSASAEDFRAALKAIGISGSARRDLVSTLTALLQLGETLGFLLDEEELDNICEDAAGLLGVDPEVLVQKCNTADRQVMMAGIYEALIDWVIAKANEAVADEIRRDPPPDSQPGAITPASHASDSEDSMNITVIEIPGSHLGKAVSLKTVFDDSEGINAEMKEDGVNVNSAGHSVVTEMKQAVASCAPDLGITGGPAGRERELEHDRREAVLDKVGQETDDDSFLRKLLYPIPEQGISLGQNGRFDLMSVIGTSRVWFHLSIHPTDASPSTLSPSVAAWSAGSVSRQLRAWRLPEWANRRNKQIDFTADYDLQEFCTQYKSLGCTDGRDGIESFILERGWSNGEVVIGKERVWMREGAYMEAETMRDMIPQAQTIPPRGMMGSAGSVYNMHPPEAGSAFFGSQFGDGASIAESRENLLQRNQSAATYTNRTHLGGRSFAPTAAQTLRSISGGDYGLGDKGDSSKGAYGYEIGLDPELGEPKNITEHPITMTRRLWAGLVWALTFWIPSFALRYIGRMKRPDIRMAWREKLILVLVIFFLNAFIIFYIIIFGRLLCPNFDKAWNKQEVGFHQGTNDFYVAVRGRVYDISKFWQIDHSNILSEPVTGAKMLPLAGKVVDDLFPIPLYVACPGLVPVNSTFQLTTNPLTLDPSLIGAFTHTSGPTTPYRSTPLENPNWYNETFYPKIKHYYIGDLVTSTSDVLSKGGSHQHFQFIMNGNVYDLTDYFYTRGLDDNEATSKIFPESFAQMVQAQPGTDLTDLFTKYAKRNPSDAAKSLTCLNNQFYIGKTDFRDTPKCQVNNYILLAFTIVLCVVILTKFLAALQLGSKRRPAAQDKFVICQVPAYTEGEDHLRKGLDSLTALAYDNKRKLICVICDGMIVGGGNDRPTPKIVLDILGVDPKIDPPALPFKSVGQGSEQLNYGKVYSGLYEYEGNVVPYVVVVKVGKESEQAKAKPGNRGKRDSQILLMSFLNRVHHRSPMSPLELEIFHQINNIIGVDPELYEYLFMVDADTSVKEDALNRLVASCANDAKIAGICGETSLENEERSWWTMIQVYEYFISHHLAKSFESLFGSVTCLPGCFCMYRLRTADKGKPLIISDKVVSEYADCEVDTLHKKNLLALGEDRYLTTLMTKHFPHMSYKFIPDAFAQTAAPETWSILLSQRRRWINSTIHNLVELMFLKDLCGFCCFSMRFVVFIDLFGTVILPATCVYLGYLIYRVASGTGQFPLISVIMIAAVYGLQAVIFIIKRQWQHVGWMIIYILAFPIYSFVLPIYAFWKQDDFSWGNTRVVLGEKGNKQIVAITEDEGFDPRSIPLQRWDDYATANNLPGRRGMLEGGGSEKAYGYEDAGYEMDDMRSVYSAAKPASTILTGFKSHGPGSLYMPPQSPSPFAQRPDLQNRGSSYSNLTGRYTDRPTMLQQNNQSQGRLMSLGNMSDAAFQHHQATLAMQQQQHQLQQQQRNPYYASTIPSMPYQQSAENLLSGGMMMSSPSPPLNRAGTRSPFNMSTPSRPGSNLPMGASMQMPMGSPMPMGVPDFQTSMTGLAEPSDASIVDAIQAVLAVVDMDTVTKKQVRSLVETRLQTTFSPARKEFLDERIDVELASM